MNAGRRRLTRRDSLRLGGVARFAEFTDDFDPPLRVSPQPA